MYNKELKVGVILNYISMIIESITLLVLTPFIIRKLGPQEYGVYNLIASFSGYLALFEFGIGTTIIRYISKYNAEKNEKAKENFLAMSIIIYAIISFVMIITAIIIYLNIGNIFSNSLSLHEISIAKTMFIIITTSIVVSTIGSIFSATISGYEKFIYARTVSIITTIINMMLTLLLVIFGVSAIKLTIITLIITSLTLLTNIAYVFLKLKVRIKLHEWDKSFFNEIFKFSFFVFLQTLVSQIYWKADELIIGIYMTSTAVAIYAVAMKLNELILAFTTVINRFQLPTITRLVFKEKNNDKLTEYMGKTSQFVAILYIGVTIGYIFFGKQFINLWAGPGYEEAYIVGLIVIIASGLNRIHGSGNDVVKAQNIHGRMTVIYFISASINVILTILLIPKWGLIGAASSSAISLILANTIAYYIYLNTKAKINISKLFRLTFKGFGVTISISTVISLLVCYFIQGNSIIEYIIKCFIFLISYLISIYIFVLSKENREKIINYIKRRNINETKLSYNK